MVEIREHHRGAIDRLVELFSDDPRFPAVIVGGSVAKGRAPMGKPRTWSYVQGGGCRYALCLRRGSRTRARSKPEYASAAVAATAKTTG